MGIVKEGAAHSAPEVRAKEHELKCFPEFFSAQMTGAKNFEIRDIYLDLITKRDFRIGDILVLREFIPCRECGGTGRVWDCGDRTDCDCIPSKHPKGQYTGRVLKRLITYITDFRQQPDVVVMGLREWMEPSATTRSCPSLNRVQGLVEHVRSLGAYTQAEEIAALGAEIKRLRQEGEDLRAALRRQGRKRRSAAPARGKAGPPRRRRVLAAGVRRARTKGRK